MAQRRKASTFYDLPGLFDDIEPRVAEPDPLQEAMEEQRRKNRVVTGDVTDIVENIERPRQLQFISFGSGSSGNSSYIGVAGEGGVIIDAGIDAQKVTDELKKNCIPLEGVYGIVLTHDHSDHVRYTYPLLRRLPKVPLFCTPRTLAGILRRHSISKRIKEYHKPIFKEFSFEAGPFTITPFETSHDGSDNVGFSITVGNRNFVIATDMGTITERADHYIRQANYLMMEANYDARMLEVGRYPEYLKARIRSDIGHLDNTVTASYLAEHWAAHLTDIYLCHLSQDNNTPEIALKAVKDALQAKGITVGDDSGSYESLRAQVRVSVLPRFDATPLYIHRL